MEGELILLVGGARSGKSRAAERMARGLGKRVLYVATAEAKDEEMEARIEEHRSKRPTSWRTVEVTSGVGSIVLATLAKGEADVVVLDCLTMLVANVLLQGLSGEELDKIDVTTARDRVAAELDELLATVGSCVAPWIVVSNEVGCGLVPPTQLGRTYRDLLGWANQRLAADASAVYWMVAGLPVNITALPRERAD